MVFQMPNRCCVPCCKSNYYASDTSAFHFPKEKDRRDKWLKAVNRKDFTPTATSVVCARHFDTRFIITEDSFMRPDGTVITAKRSRPALTKDAYPTIFPERPAYLSKKLPLVRLTPQERRDRLAAHDGTKSLKKKPKRKVGPSTSKCSVEVYPSVVTKKRKLSEHSSFHQLPESAKEVMDSGPFEFIDMTKSCSDYDMLEEERMRVKVEQCNDNENLEEERMKVKIEDSIDNEKFEERMKVKIEDCSDDEFEEESMKVKIEDCTDEDVIVKVEHDIDEDDESKRANKFVSDKKKDLYRTGCGPPSPDIRPDELEPDPNHNDSDNWPKGAPAKLYDESNPDWAPSLELGYTKSTRSSTRKSAARYQHAAKRRKRATDINTAKISLELSNTTDDVPLEEIPEQVEAVSEKVESSSRDSSAATDQAIERDEHAAECEERLRAAEREERLRAAEHEDKLREREEKLQLAKMEADKEIELARIAAQVLSSRQTPDDSSCWNTECSCVIVSEDTLSTGTATR
ncbi:hypothetical protein Pcinc_002103 [Petrolisthes cinctipes]|uniref:THAP-type domain-containing protein n=1 Tax=Petrolisthes cinctipes TaxID=88211 RepID=A0AAE1L2I6_PETCI|nr:hypothetical protein Pcinc_002103 [Petrolisthes cinctipes]